MPNGKPTKEHENKIDEICESGGFLKSGFPAFFKILMIDSAIGQNSEIDINDAYNRVANKDCTNAVKMRTKRALSFYKKLIPYAVDYETGEQLTKHQYESLDKEVVERFNAPYAYCDFYAPEFGIEEEIIPIHEFLEIASKHLTAIPDCWKYDHEKKLITIYEVTDTCHLSGRRLTKISILEDLLFYSCGIRLDVIEYRLVGSHGFSHEVSWWFDAVINSRTLYDVDIDCRKSLKRYYRENQFVS